MYSFDHDIEYTFFPDKVINNIFFYLWWKQVFLSFERKICVVMALIAFKSGDICEPKKPFPLNFWFEICLIYRGRGADPIHNINDIASMI